MTFHAGHNNCTIHEFLLECNVCGESWPIIIITERSNETRSEHYGVNLLGISLSIRLVDPSYIKKDRYLSYLYIIYHLFCQKEQTFIVFCKKKFALDIVMIFLFVYKWYLYIFKVGWLFYAKTWTKHVVFWRFIGLNWPFSMQINEYAGFNLKNNREK